MVRFGSVRGDVAAAYVVVLTGRELHLTIQTMVFRTAVVNCFCCLSVALIVHLPDLGVNLMYKYIFTRLIPCMS